MFRTFQCSEFFNVLNFPSCVIFFCWLLYAYLDKNQPVELFDRERENLDVVQFDDLMYTFAYLVQCTQGKFRLVGFCFA